MFKKSLLFLSLLLLPVVAYAGDPPYCYVEQDGDPKICLKQFEVENGTLSLTGGKARYVAPTGAASGDINDVGDCSSGSCFNGTQGTTLTFNNAGGDATLTYDGADFVLTKPLGIVASSVPSYTSLEIENTSTVDESSAIEILRNVSQTGNVGSFHFGLDSGVHWNLAGFNMTGNMRAVYGGIAPGDNVGGGTFTDLMNFYAYLTGDALEDYDITNHYGLYLAFNNPGIGTISNLYGSRFIPIGTNNGTISNIVGYQIDAVAGASSTKGFVGSISSGSGKYNLYMDGTAINYLAGNTGIGVVPTTKFNIQSTSARYVNFFDVNSTNSHIFRIDDNSAVNLFTLENRDITATTDHGIDIEYQFADNVDTTARAAGTIRLLKEQQWTSTASTRDSYMEFHTALDGVPTKAVKIDSSGNLQVVGRATAQELRMYEATGSGSNYTAFKAQPQAGDITYTLPPDDGDAGEQLQTDGSGNLTWEAAGSGGSGDVTDVGDCTTGACFNGTTGTTLTFNNAGGDATLDYDGTDLEVNKDFKVNVGASIGAFTFTNVASSYPFLMINNTLGTAPMGSGIRFQKNGVNQFGFGIDYVGNGARNWWVYDYVSSTPRLLIDDNGRVGIGSTAPDKKLEINDASGGSLRLTYNDSNGSAATYGDFEVNSSGNINISPSGGEVGIGNTAPAYKLEVGDLTTGANTTFSAAVGAVAVSDSGNSTKFIGENTGADGSSSGSFVALVQNDGTAVASGNRLGGLQMGGHDGVDRIRLGAAVVAYADGTYSATSVPTYLSFETAASGSTTQTERLKIGSSTESAVTIKNVMTLTPQASVPASPVVGMIYVDSTPTPDALCFYNGTDWDDISAAATDANCA